MECYTLISDVIYVTVFFGGLNWRGNKDFPQCSKGFFLNNVTLVKMEACKSVVISV